MTAVQLPEVPEPFMDLHRDLTPVMYDAWSTQLREYATKAVMADRLLRRYEAFGPCQCPIKITGEQQ